MDNRFVILHFQDAAFKFLGAESSGRMAPATREVRPADYFLPSPEPVAEVAVTSVTSSERVVPCRLRCFALRGAVAFGLLILGSVLSFFPVVMFVIGGRQ